MDGAGGDRMLAMVLTAPGEPLVPAERDAPQPAAGEVLLGVSACGVCRTDLHLADGELPEPRFPVVPGHQIVGWVVAKGDGVEGLSRGDRVGVPWLGSACGTCRFCRHGRENLCDRAVFTGYTRDGGFATHALADARFCFRLPDGYSDLEAAPLLCAGLIGYRAYRLCGEHVERLGLYGFGAAAHILCQVATAQGREVYAFTRPGDATAQAFARELGAVWAAGSDERPPVALDAAILFAPVGDLVPVALGAVEKGGVVVAAGIHMSDIPSFPYRLLWDERVLRSVANLTRRDGREFLELAAQAPFRTHVTTYPLAEANAALTALRTGEVEGAIVLDAAART